MILTPNPKRTNITLPKLNSRKSSLTRLKITANPKILHFNFSSKPSSNKLHQSPEKPSQVHLESLKLLCIHEKEQVSNKVIMIQNRINAIKSLQRKFKIKFTQHDIRTLSIEKLEKKAKKLHEQDIKHRSALKIATWWKRILIIKKIKKQDLIFEKAARAIQKSWQKYLIQKQFKLKQLELWSQMNESAIRIQRHFKGFSIRKKTSVLLNQLKLQRNFNFFEKMRKMMLSVVFERCVSIFMVYKIKQNYIKLYNKTIEKEKNQIISLLKDSKTTGSIAIQINSILHKTRELSKDQVLTEPSSPLICKNRLRSCTEDFLFLSPLKCENLVY